MSAKKQQKNTIQSAQPTLTIAGGPIAPPIKVPGVKPQFKSQVQSFNAWWALVANKRKLNPALKASVQRHFESSGFMKSGEFDKGLKHFGL